MQKLIYSVFALLLLLVVVGFLLPRKHQVDVSVEVNAPPATLFALVNDFRHHREWSPWKDIDPEARIEYTGEPSGVGATMSWNGVALGSGTQTIIASRPFEHIEIALNPGEDGEARAWFTFTPGMRSTLVTWSFEVDYGFNVVGRYFAPVLGGIVARDYQNGLIGLKALAESLPPDGIELSGESSAR